MRYFLTGTLVPDATCDYIRSDGFYNGKEYYARAVPGYHIWWDPIGTWTISALLGIPGDNYWTNASETLTGFYGPGGDATGDATLTVGYHTVNVTGTLSPDVTCNYPYTGTHHDKPFYMRSDAVFYIWWDTETTSWILSDALDSKVGPYWQRIDPSVIGLYTPQNTATGEATVALGQHP